MNSNSLGNKKESSRALKSDYKENLDFDAQMKVEEAKNGENELKAKEDKNEAEFFEKLKHRLNNKDIIGDPTQSNNEGIQNLRRVSLAIPNIVSRQNTLTVQKNMFSKKNTLLSNLSKNSSFMARQLPKTVRQPSFIKQVEAIRKQNTNLIIENNKLDTVSIEDKKYKEVTKAIEKFLDSTVIIVIMAVATVFVLLGDDIKTLSLPPSVDFGFDITKTICFALFLLEIIFSCIAKKDYIFSFFFWLDLVSTVSLIQDIDFMINPMIYGSDK